MKTIIPILIAIVALSASAAAAEPEVIVELGSARVYQGESVLYRVTLNNFENPSPPRLERFDDFQVESLGQTSLNSTFTRIINGQVTTIERRGEQYSYRLTPLKAGLLRIPAPTAKLDGRTISGSEKVLDVIAPDEQDLVIIELTADRQSLYPMQPFELTLSILVKGLPTPNSDRNPVADRFTDRSDMMGSRSLPRNLRIPWLPDDNLPDGIEPVESWQRWLQPLQNRGGAGFAINNFGQRSVMSLFDEGPACFQPRPRRVVRNDADGNEVDGNEVDGNEVDGNEVDYWQFDFKRKFIPKRIGRFTFGPVTFKGPVTTAVEGMQVNGEKVYALAPAITVVVNDVPEAGRPDSYIGAVGSFQLSADLRPRKAKVRDHMTLTLSLHGEGTLENATPPDLSKMPVVADAFKVYEANEEGKGSSRTFTYSIRPLKEGTEHFPAIPVSYFDVDSDRYVTLRSEPMAIEVGKADRLQIVRGSAGNGDNVHLRHEGIFANVTDLSTVKDQSINPPRWFAAMGGLLAAYMLILLVTRRVRHRSEDTALVRRRGAAARARSAVKNAMVELHADRLREGADHLQDAVAGLVADVANLTEAGLTPRDMENQLRDLGVESELVDRLHGLLEACDAARYGSAGRSAGELAKNADTLVNELIKSLKAKKRFR
jgi:hypothetical protein